jgi:hypothetical protein
MNIKNLVLVGIVVIAGGAAFVYFDPLGLDLLGSKKSTTVAQPVVPPRASTAAKPVVSAPKASAAPAPAQVNAPVAAAPVAPSPTAKPAVVPAPAPVVPAPVETPNVATPAQAIEPPLKLAKTITTAKKPSQPGQPASKATGKPERAKNLDLRHCLELETDAAIAKCAGE